ncbi:ATPase family AAA domain-containing protein 1-like protein, partial [Tanacetum coccineum]
MKVIQTLIWYAASAAVSYWVIITGLRQLDTNREENKRAVEQRKHLFRRLNRTFIQTTPYEDIIACDVVNPNNVDVEFDSIGGLDSTKQALYELAILPLRRPKLFASGRLLGLQKGVLLYGPPGTGKTMLAKAIAKESAVFSLAHKLQPAIIFIDEVDSFLRQRRSSDNDALTNMKTEFMALWDGFTTDKNARVMVLAATNRPSDLDEAILRRLPQ